MLKSQMIAKLLVAATLCRTEHEALYVARSGLIAASSPEAFAQWDTLVPDDFALRYVRDHSWMRRVNWASLFRDLS